MSDQARTEQPTPRKLREARRRGEVARSRDLTAAVCVWAVLAAVALGVVPAIGSLLAAASGTLGAAGSASAPVVAGWAAACGEIAARLSLPVLLAAFAATLAAAAVQVGGLFSMEAVKPKLERIDPGRGARRILGSRGWIEAAKSLLKFAIVAGAAMLAAHSAFQDIVRSATLDASALAAAVGGLLLRTALIAGGALVVLGFADLAYQRRRHRRDLRMTREEVKREHKEEEGQPEIKAERMRLHREMLAHRMVMDVPRATCVIVNPTHVAVALRYDADDEDAAPIVLAKGEGELARRIVEAARAAGVPVLRNAHVARSLLACELGEAIPERLFEAVAEVMRVILAEEE